MLYRKYRPQTFDDVVGQETTVRILKNILTDGRIHHAYLFTGPRGVGKTSLARILGKGLNCEKGPTTTPCGVCLNCVEIVEGRSLAVMEIDGASNTSVDDIRDLREKVRYLAPGGRFKIYIIDEVHMLSTAAFNALLKTLEEPPPHAVFVLATTEPHKVPVTIISRCLRFDLRPIAVPHVVERLGEIAKKEGIEATDEALFEISRESAGGLRDALGLLDQAASFSQNRVTREVVEEILGASPRRFLTGIFSGVLQRDGKRVLEELQKSFQAGVDPRRLATELLNFTRDLLVATVSTDRTLFDLPEEEIGALRKLGEEAGQQTLDQLFQIIQRGHFEIQKSPIPQILLESINHTPPTMRRALRPS